MESLHVDREGIIVEFSYARKVIPWASINSIAFTANPKEEYKLLIIGERGGEKTMLQIRDDKTKKLFKYICAANPSYPPAHLLQLTDETIRLWPNDVAKKTLPELMQEVVPAPPKKLISDGWIGSTGFLVFVFAFVALGILLLIFW